MARFDVDEGRIAGYEAAQRDAARLWPRIRSAGASALRALSWAPWMLVGLAGLVVVSFAADALGRVVVWFVLLGWPIGWACERIQLRQWRELAAGVAAVAVAGYVALRAFGA